MGLEKLYRKHWSHVLLCHRLSYVCANSFFLFVKILKVLLKKLLIYFLCIAGICIRFYAWHSDIYTESISPSQLFILLKQNMLACLVISLTSYTGYWFCAIWNVTDYLLFPFLVKSATVIEKKKGLSYEIVFCLASGQEKNKRETMKQLSLS